MTSASQVLLDEYLASTYEPDREYIDGELVERNMGESDHAGLQALLSAWLASRRRQLAIHVFTELRIEVSSGRYRIPDITVTRRKIQGRILREPPLLCIEILSPEDRASRFEGKIDEYLAFGVPHIWVIDPRKRHAWSYSHEGKREATTLLTTSDPRIELPIMDLFNELQEDVAAE